MGETIRHLSVHDLRTVEVRRGEHGLTVRETTCGESTRAVFDSECYTRCVEVPLQGEYVLARFMGVAPKDLAEELESYLYREGSQFTDILDLLDMRGIPYRLGFGGEKELP